ncbi:hypothetical protein KUTeg_019108 [Tegillarca granosa]|uniref:Photolyase/cryptochrome alpha/beta domain-containing protein n=1 Tax=Tegillarca granosa TaxID=220873 RepID=A0ABQ9EGK6_TEGGR|nr:hypothetical protein KUTeg_019108 [Tegillarca granosa]
MATTEEEYISSESFDILHNCINGCIDADECFCMMLSVDGFDKTRNTFLSNIEQIEFANPVLHKQLTEVYGGYFSNWHNSPSAIECSVENGYLTSDFGYELDMDMALRVSGGEIPNPDNANEDEFTTTLSYASCFQPPKKKPDDGLGMYNIKDDVSPQCSKDIKQEQSLRRKNKHGAEKVQNHNITNSIPVKERKRKSQGMSSVPYSISNRPIVYWMRKDLRLYDNPALCAASLKGAPVLVTFIWSEKDENGPINFLGAGGATKVWLHEALKELNKDLIDKYGNGILFYKTSDVGNQIKEIMRQSNAQTLIIDNVYEPFVKQRDDKICEDLSKNKGINIERFDSLLLHEPDSINTESVYMRGIGSVVHFMECCRQSSTKPIGHPLDSPPFLPKIDNIPSSMVLDELKLAKMPVRKDGTVIDWAAPIRKSWDFSEKGAWDALTMFLEEGRADNLNTCRISPYLHFGQISPRSILTEARHMKSPKFLRKLAWRDLAYWLLTLWPDLPVEPTRPHYKHQRWSDNKAHLKAWQRGNTGYPLVDAAMRQLWLTGWLNNYMRHVVASFLISYLHLHWKEGYLWFQDTLLDADVAINAMMWQNGGMSGLDQWNFVMHPVDAAMTCDPKGDYVRQWCPELQKMPEEFIHKPWKCPPSILKRCNVQLGVTYPHRIITNLEEAREQSLKDVMDLRKKHQEYVCPRTGLDLVPIPSGLLLPVITRKEFRYKLSNPDSKDNPYSAVLKGYRSRQRDEAIAYANQRDFLASTMNECVLRHDRSQKANKEIRL